MSAKFTKEKPKEEFAGVLATKSFSPNEEKSKPFTSKSPYPVHIIK